MIFNDENKTEPFITLFKLCYPAYTYITHAEIPWESSWTIRLAHTWNLVVWKSSPRGSNSRIQWVEELHQHPLPLLQVDLQECSLRQAQTRPPPRCPEEAWLLSVASADQTQSWGVALPTGLTPPPPPAPPSHPFSNLPDPNPYTWPYASWSFVVSCFFKHSFSRYTFKLYFFLILPVLFSRTSTFFSYWAWWVK